MKVTLNQLDHPTRYYLIGLHNSHLLGRLRRISVGKTAKIAPGLMFCHTPLRLVFPITPYPDGGTSLAGGPTSGSPLGQPDMPTSSTIPIEEKVSLTLTHTPLT